MIAKGGILLLLMFCQGCEIKRPTTCTSSSSYSSPDGPPDRVETTCRDGDEETKVIREGDKVTCMTSAPMEQILS